MKFKLINLNNLIFLFGPLWWEDIFQPPSMRSMVCISVIITQKLHVTIHYRPLCEASLYCFNTLPKMVWLYYASSGIWTLVLAGLLSMQSYWSKHSATTAGKILQQWYHESNWVCKDNFPLNFQFSYFHIVPKSWTKLIQRKWNKKAGVT